MTDIKIDSIVRSKRKTVSLEVSEEGRLVVRAPRLLPKVLIEQIVREKKDWVLKQLERRRFADPQYFFGAYLMYRGLSYPLRRGEGGTQELFLCESGFFAPEMDVLHGQGLFQAWYKREADEVIKRRVLEVGEKHAAQFHKVRISSAKKRWGSCSSTGTISISWRLILAPSFVLDYVIVHELAHLIEMNHSKQFWGIVNDMYPHHKMAREWLRKYGNMLKV